MSYICVIHTCYRFSGGRCHVEWSNCHVASSNGESCEILLWILHPMAGNMAGKKNQDSSMYCYALLCKFSGSKISSILCSEWMISARLVIQIQKLEILHRSMYVFTQKCISAICHVLLTVQNAHWWALFNNNRQFIGFLHKKLQEAVSTDINLLLLIGPWWNVKHSFQLWWNSNLSQRL